MDELYVALLADPVKEKKSDAGSKYRAVTMGCGRRNKVFRRRPVRRSRSFTASNQLIDTDYWKRFVALFLLIACSEWHSCILTLAEHINTGTDH